jgi:hypothetical protein
MALATIEEIDRINVKDLKASGEGEMHILHNETIVRVKCFITDPERYFTDEEASDIMYGRRTMAEVRRSKEAAEAAAKH